MAGLVASGNAGSLNGASKVELVPTPGVGVTRLVRSMYVNHTDSVTVTLHLAKKISGNWYQIHSQLMLQGWTMEIGDGDIIALNQGESLEAWLDSSPATNPTFVVSWGDNS